MHLEKCDLKAISAILVLQDFGTFRFIFLLPSPPSSHHPVRYLPAVICRWAAELATEAFLLNDHLLVLRLCQHEAAFCPHGWVAKQFL